MQDDADAQFCSLMGEMATSMRSAREVIKSLRDRTDLESKDGISLLSLKHHVLLSYLQSLALVSSRRALGDSLLVRTRPELPFSSSDRSSRGADLGDLVDSMVEARIVLEKIKTLESRMRYQIEKLVRVAEEPEKSQDIVNDPLAFRPNPQNLMGNSDQESDASDAEVDQAPLDGPVEDDDIYRPPRLAPVPYIEKSKSQRRKERPPVPSALASLAYSAADPSRPYQEATSGLGATPGLASARAAHLKRMTEYEEENFSRLVMKKSEARRRARDEAALALGDGLGGSSNPRRRVAGGLEDEFGDVLRSVERASGARGPGGGIGDGYDELRQKGKKKDVLGRSRAREEIVRDRSDAFGDDNESTGLRARKKTRFEMERKLAKRKASRTRR
ncbi:hypothetical protein AX16_003678 [Volvariella volvacea WC 439]|nr:hypothetical protein AX16_003678 [Volvariella volvacea WC 439]